MYGVPSGLLFLGQIHSFLLRLAGCCTAEKNKNDKMEF